MRRRFGTELDVRPAEDHAGEPLAEGLEIEVGNDPALLLIRAKAFRQPAEALPSDLTHAGGEFGPTLGAAEDEQAALTDGNATGVEHHREQRVHDPAQLLLRVRGAELRQDGGIELVDRADESLGLRLGHQTLATAEEVVDRGRRHIDGRLELLDAQRCLATRVDDADRLVEDLLRGGMPFHRLRA